MGQSPHLEANRHSAGQQILKSLWNLKVQYHGHNSPPLFPILSKMRPDHTFPLCYPNIHSSIKFPSTLKSFKWSLSGFPTISAHINLLDSIALIIFCEAYKFRSSSLCGLLRPPTTSSNLGPNIPLSTLFSFTLNLSPFLKMIHQVLHPYKTSKIVVWCILIFKF